MTLDDIILPGTQPEILGQGYGFTEGPAADRHGNVYFSDGKNDSIYYWEVGQPVVRFVDDSTDAIGMMFNARGELYVCEGAAYRIVAYDVRTKAKRVLCSQIDGQHFNEPNDLAIDFCDGFYFSDPNYQHHGQPTVMKQDVYYCSAEGRVTRVSTVCHKPNGVLLSADDRTLYVADARGQVIYRYDVVASRPSSPAKGCGSTNWGQPGRPDVGRARQSLHLLRQGRAEDLRSCGPARRPDRRSRRQLLLRRRRLPHAVHRVGRQVPRHSHAGGGAETVAAAGVGDQNTAMAVTSAKEFFAVLEKSKLLIPAQLAQARAAAGAGDDPKPSPSGWPAKTSSPAGRPANCWPDAVPSTWASTA